MKRIGLRAKLVSLLGLILLVLFSIVTIILVQQSTTTLRSNLNERSKAFAILATKPIADTFLLYKDSGKVRITQQAQKFYELDKDIVSVSVINTAGKVQYSYGNEKRKSIPIAPSNDFNAQYTRDQHGTVTQIVQPYVEDYGGYRYALVYTVSSQRADQQILSLTQLLIGLSILFTILSLTLLYIVFNIVFIRPVREVSRLAGVISGGDFTQEITVKNNDEIGDLAVAVNTMSNSLKSDIIQLKETDRLKNEFIMISSHNLRTPLTVINGYIDMIKNLDIDNQLKELLGIIDKNTTKLTKLTEDMLTISTVESGGALVTNNAIDIAPLITKLSEEFNPVFKTKNISFSVINKLGKSRALISKSHFISAVSNVLENALKFTPEHGSVSLIALLEKGDIQITITDSGIGISEDEIPLLFTKFHRGTDTLQYEYEGVGLGLYLTKIIIDQFRGSVAIESSKEKGTRFTITLPISTDGATDSGR